MDGDLSSLGELQDHLLSLICPSRTHMVCSPVMSGF